MKLPISNIIDTHKIKWPILTILVGITCSYSVLLFFRSLTNTYATMLSFAMMIPFIIFIVGDAKRFLWVILVVCLPITVNIVIGDASQHIGVNAFGYIISLFDIILAFLYVLWLAEMVRKRNISIDFFPRISIPAMFLIGAATLSMLVAPFPDLSKYEIIEMLKIYLAFLYLANNIRNKSDVQFVVTILLICLFFEGLLGWAQHRHDEPFFPTALGGPPWVDSRVKGTWSSFNDFSFYLTFILPIALSLLFSQIKSLYKLISFSALATGLAALAWTGSRGGWISFIGAGLFVCPLVFIKIKGKTGLIKVFASLMVAVILVSPLYPRLANKIYGRFTGNDGGSAMGRITQFNVAYDMIQDNPVIGVGINNFTKVMFDYDNTEEGLLALTPYPVHNIYLQIASEMGIFGIASFIWFISVIYIEGIRYVTLNQGLMVYVVIGMLGGIIAFLIHGFVDTASLGNKLILFIWFFAGIICAIKKIKSDGYIDNHI